ncbi:uncharacterized protein LOC117584514 [Drosophila guanche]|uniref:uncharacterized protein LOC117584514 n=1 Tax=Drosophila guanche TaxID=7266 RepID=UPI0014714577|nr:uncharacterized protein LOC117584514 [Drosophila guanche]
MEPTCLAKENSVPSMSIKKNLLSINNSTIKKNARKVVLGNLDNVLHQNQTPFKFDSQNISCPKSVAKLPLQNLHRHLNERGEDNLKIIPSYLGLYSLANEVCSQNAYENIFDYMDFSNTKCLNNCWRSIPEIWLDNLSGKDTFTEQFLNNLDGLVEHFENDYFISVCNVLCENDERDACSQEDTDNTGTEHCEYKLDLQMPMPNLDDMDILF